MDDPRDVFLTIRLGLARVVSKIVPPHEVEDIVQETYVRLCQVGAPERIQHPKSYLYRTARNLALDSLKLADNSMTESWSEDEEGSGAAIREYDATFEQAASSEEFGHFCEAVRQLPVQARRVFVLKKVYGYSQREIAKEMGLSESTVEKHIALAVRRCASLMKGLSRKNEAKTGQAEVRGE